MKGASAAGWVCGGLKLAVTSPSYSIKSTEEVRLPLLAAVS